MKVARVFPRKTNMSPRDKDAYFGPPDLYTPRYDVVFISVCFTWDTEKAGELMRAWKPKAKRGHVYIGGPAYDDPGHRFIPGRFLRPGVVITSRGCPNNCPWCFVPKREGKIKVLPQPVPQGNIIQDNNLLACPKQHRDRVFTMLAAEKNIDFAGGLEAARITPRIVDVLRGLRIRQIWLAYDHPNAEKPLIRAVNRLKKYFTLNQLRCYVLIGTENDTIEKATNRLKRAWEIGTKPFAMRLRRGGEWGESFVQRGREWNLLTTQWTRPAIYYAIMKGI